ncbi:hypothetical protein FNF27_08095 [Cafeteria roenbergensis]|uniref:Uncharacterized protein n=1 Tax=Cafeteria roenbergensis TaxID=33653 RepID=A0A5A8DC56_CAFRO|nr:hypothetical protein FNF27_08095 [Cafeteria roenbergensis]KAA0165959.1 hypothetical protein FNF31_01573 [Cafeteria roenbergensis]
MASLSAALRAFGDWMYGAFADAFQSELNTMSALARAPGQDAPARQAPATSRGAPSHLVAADLDFAAAAGSAGRGSKL